ncbi:MAG: hypothetical protein ACKPKO_48745, partial [Candidatus Fonsibacter sp.]
GMPVAADAVLAMPSLLSRPPPELPLHAATNAKLRDRATDELLRRKLVAAASTAAATVAAAAIATSGRLRAAAACAGFRPNSALPIARKSADVFASSRPVLKPTSWLIASRAETAQPKRANA